MQKISRKQFDAAFELLRNKKFRKGPTLDQIAEQAGISRATVRNIRRGTLKRPPADADPPRMPSAPKLHDGVEFNLVAPYRCPTCGMIVTLRPCLYCHHKAKKQKECPPLS